MGCKKFFFIFIFITCGCQSECQNNNDSLISKNFKKKITIEIKDLSNNIFFNKKYISKKFKNSIKNYIIKKGLIELVNKNGDVIVNENFIKYELIKNYSEKKNKITILLRIYYNKKNFSSDFKISNLYEKNKDIFPEKIINNIIRKLTILVYSQIESEMIYNL